MRYVSKFRKEYPAGPAPVRVIAMNLKKALLLVNIALTALAVWAAVNIVLTWTSNRGAADLPGIAAAGAAAADRPFPGTVKKAADYAVVFQNDMFHTAGDAPAPAVLPATDTEIEDLGLFLKGTVVGGPKGSFAVIRDEALKKEDLYHVNDYVKKARIVDILPDRVILRLNGREAPLLLTEKISAPAPRARGKGSRPVRNIRKRRRPGM